MSKLVLWSDLHLGHRNAIKWRQQFSTPEEHDETLFEALAVTIQKRDCLYLLGDVAFDLEWLDRIGTIKCTKKVIVLGNHDTEGPRKNRLRGEDFIKVFDEVHGMTKKGGAWLTHAPIHPQELRGKINIHGHCHSHVITKTESQVVGMHFDRGTIDVETKDDRYINICPEQTNWKPVIFQTLMGGRQHEGR